MGVAISGRKPLRRTYRIVWGGGLAAMLALSASAYLIATGLDSQHLERERRLLRTGLAEVIDAVPVGQESATIWDDAVRETRNGNELWMRENLGEWMGSYFGFNAALVLNEKNEPIHVMRNGTTLSPALELSEAAALEPLIDQLRGDIIAQSNDGILPYQEGAELGRMALVSLAGEPAVLSLKPIVPGSPNLLLPTDQVYLHAAIQKVDAELLAAISTHFELAGLTLEPVANSAASEALVADHGEVLGYLVWLPDRPAMQLLGKLLPVALVCGLMLMGLASWLLGRLRHTAGRQKLAEARALYESLHDPLTDLANRERLDQLISAATAGGPVSLHVLDVDRFALINDTLGHAAGDELLCQIADRLMEAVGDSGSVARIGGDEFAVLQRLPPDAEPKSQVDRIVMEFNRPFQIAGEHLPVQCCLGTAISVAEISPPELLRRAHIALAQARTGGRGGRVQFTLEMDATALRRSRLERDLRAALVAGELSVAYQAIVAADGRRVLGAEALVRWRHPSEGPISPDVFITIAEDNGLIEPLGEYVLRQACACAVLRGLPWIAVNVSPVQLRSAAFCDLVFAVLAETGLEPGRLQLEITEGALLENTNVAQAVLQRLRERGVRIALDDFGTGYSSMSYLAKYAVDKIKIDKSFVAQLGGSAQSRAIVRAMVDLADAFQLSTTAEGVETLDQHKHLAAIGCQELQGYLFSRPLEFEAFASYVETSRRAEGAAGDTSTRMIAGNG